MNTPVSFPLAKLVKEKGFDIPCTEGWINYLTSFTGETGMPDDESNLVLDRLGNPHLIERPTIDDVVMWLYEKHGIWVYPRPVLDEDGGWIFKGYVKLMANFKAKEIQTKLMRQPTEAYEAAIEYTLNNLI